MVRMREESVSAPRRCGVPPAPGRFGPAGMGESAYIIEAYKAQLAEGDAAE